ncbi:O-Antigen ligase [Hyunsoonleella jejuensis]|uniref:O-Antigen ligase n=1 Tax=Hyunsoonleella jejuensis TaxID=419940 RepID=A0A1H9G748_9FLAO|nr:O-antigen ligase family protein [Hyunsoonleella jejuensis]SEQ45889.1 O-Antigen ligase [Hyunsoonleella jejuensis]
MKYVLFFFIILFVSGADRFLFRVGIVPVSPAYLLVPLSFVMFFIKFDIRKYFIYLKTHTAKFLFLTFICTLIFSLNDKVSFEIMLNEIVAFSTTVLLYSFCLIFFTECSTKEIRFFLFIGFIVICASIYYDMFIGLPVTDVDLVDQARKGGFAENPNTAASAVKFLGLGLLLLYASEKKMRMVVLTIMLSSVFITFSRSGLLSVILIVIFLSLNEWKIFLNIKFSRLLLTSLKMILLFGFFYMLILVFADIIRQEVPAFREGAAGERLDLLTGQSDEIITSDDRTSDGRSTLVIRYLNKFADNPLGSGTAYCADKNISSKNTHNYFLRVSVEYGIFGLIIFIIFLYKSIKLAREKEHFYYLVFIILIIFESVISHYLFVEKPIVVVLALLDYSLYYRHTQEDSEQNESVLVSTEPDLV